MWKLSALFLEDLIMQGRCGAFLVASIPDNGRMSLIMHG
jgi:hypothetical protein